MWLFVWKKYEDSWMATAVSFVGYIVVFLAAILCGLGVSALIRGTVGGILGIVAGLAVYIALRAALNRLTDAIAIKQLNADANRIIRKNRKAEADGKVRDAALLEAIAHESDQDKLLRAVKESRDIKVGRVCHITFEQSMEGVRRLDQAHLLQFIQWWGSGFCNRMVLKQRQKSGEPMDIPTQRLKLFIGMVSDPARRAELTRHYYLD